MVLTEHNIWEFALASAEHQVSAIDCRRIEGRQIVCRVLHGNTNDDANAGVMKKKKRGYACKESKREMWEKGMVDNEGLLHSTR